MTAPAQANTPFPGVVKRRPYVHHLVVRKSEGNDGFAASLRLALKKRILKMTRPQRSPSIGRCGGLGTFANEIPE